MNILVVGASGVIGRRVVNRLVTDGHRVTAAMRPGSTRTLASRPGLDVRAVDVFDGVMVAEAMEGREAVVNLATRIPSPGLPMLMPGAWKENDRLRGRASGILVAAAASQGVRVFVQESYAPIYAAAGDAWIDEGSLVAPAKHNRSVVTAEIAVREAASRAMQTVVLRFGWLYGPDSTALLAAMRTMRYGIPPLLGPDDAYISSVSHHDAARAVVAALHVDSGIYNVVDDRPLTHRAYFDAIASTFGVRRVASFPRWIVPMFGSVGDVSSRSQRLSNSKFKGATSWAPRDVDALDGLKRMALRTAGKRG